MTNDIKQAVKELREALAAAWPGRWSVTSDDTGQYMDTVESPDGIVCDCNLGEDNAAFIVAARNHLPAVLDRLEELEPPGAGCCDLTMQPPPKECDRIEMLKSEVEKLRDKIAKHRARYEDCGEDGACGFSPGCSRHWEERNRELVAEARAERARFLEFREAVDQWVSCGTEADGDVSALNRILARFPVEPEAGR